MRKVIYKYTIKDLVGEQTLFLPKGAQILSVQFQKDILCMWAIVNLNEAEREERVIEIVETGAYMKDIETNSDYKRSFIATYQTSIGVGHIFEIIFSPF